MKENTFYFTHDFNAQNDEKVESMIFRLGWESYGLFWALIEKLAQDPNHRLKKEYDRISNVLRTTENLIKRIVEDFGLFVVDLEFFYSERLIRHFEKREEKSQKAKDSIKKRWDKNTNVIRTYNECNTIKERKGKESKVNEIKEKEILKEENIGAEAPALNPIKSKINNFKAFNEDQFKLSLEQYSNEFPSSLISDFFDYWSEPDTNGKMRFQKQDTWELKRRLRKWQKNNEGKNIQAIKGNQNKGFMTKQEKVKEAIINSNLQVISQNENPLTFEQRQNAYIEKVLIEGEI